jgi:molybdate transport system substrate-binding protein
MECSLVSLRVIILSLLLSASASAETIRVAAAVSLRDAMEAISKSFEADTQHKIEFIFGASGQLSAQIKSGADVDVFISAANAQVDDLTQGGLVADGSRVIVTGNEMVLVVPAIAKDPPRDFASLADPRFRRIAIGEPKTVPAGQYAMQVLTKLRLSELIKDRLIYGANVRQVLTYVEQGEVAAGLVYATDAKESGSKVRVVATAAADTHEPIVYPAVVLKTTRKTTGARAFLEYLKASKARDVLSEKGFSPTTNPAK